jgi:hypothetical protein
MAIRWPAVIRTTYCLCLGGAAFNHARTLFEHGLRYDYGGVPLFYRVFWTGLTFFDPLAIVLLLAFPRAGLALTLAIIVADVAVNATATVVIGPDLMALGAQMLFLAFVLATIGYAWPRTRKPS